MADTITTPTASKTVVLEHDIRVNGVLYNAGRQDVPKEVAEDLERINRDYNQQLINLHKKNVFERNMGSMAAGSGSA